MAVWSGCHGVEKGGGRGEGKPTISYYDAVAIAIAMAMMVKK